MNSWQDKLIRAKQHSRELEVVIKSFFDSQPYKISTKRNPQTRQLIYFVTSANDLPKEIPLITGDIIQNLKSALDHLAYQLFTTETKGKIAGTHIYFPIAKDLQTYESVKNKKTVGIAQPAKDLIDALKPYKGGNDILWRINELNNTDKHRLLITVGSSFGSLDIGAHMGVLMKKLGPGFDIPMPSLFLKPADILFPLKAGDELFIDGPDAQEIPNMQFKFNIVLNEPGIVGGEPLIDVLTQMESEIDKLIPIFDPLFQ